MKKRRHAILGFLPTTSRAVRRRGVLAVLVLSLAAWAQAQDQYPFEREGEPILRFLPGSQAWSLAPYEYLTGPDGSRVEKPRQPELSLRLETLPASDRQYAGRPVLHLSGSLNALCDTIVLSPPFVAPAKGALASGPGDRAHPESGFFYDAGVVRTASLCVMQGAQPIGVSLSFENERGGRYSVDFEMRGSSRHWITYTYYDQQYWNIPAEERLKIRLGWLRLKSITIRSLELQDEKNQYIQDLGDMTADQRHALSEDATARPIKETKVDLLILAAWVDHDLIPHYGE
jgi:hypothetical protein